MKSARNIFVVVMALSTLLACQKEVSFQNQGNNSGGSGSTASIEGNYDYKGSTAFTKSTVVTGIGPAQEKAVTTSNYTSLNNTGTVQITSNKFISSNIAYSINSVAFAEFYIGGILIDTISAPFVFDLPATSGTSDYRKIGTDSLYFDGGFAGSGPTGGTGGGATGSIPTGAKFRWSGDTLILNMNFSMSTTQDIGGGIMAQITNEGSQTVKLKKR